MGIVTIIIMTLLGLAGLVFSALAALVCGCIAIYKKMPVGKFAATGALYGLFIVPWIYLAARMFDRRVPLPILAMIYLFPYALWLCFLVGIGVNIDFLWDSRLGSYAIEGRGVRLGSLVVTFLLFGCIATVCLLALVRSVREIYLRQREDRRIGLNNRMPSIAYLKPFIYAYLWFCVGGLFAAFVTASVLVSGGIDIQGF